MLSLGNTCAPVPRPVSHMHAAAAVGAGSVSEMTQAYKLRIKTQLPLGGVFERNTVLPIVRNK